MDYQKSRRPKRIVGEGKGIQVNGPAKANRVNPRHNYQTEDERRYLNEKTLRNRREQPGEQPMSTKRVPERSNFTRSMTNAKNIIGAAFDQAKQAGDNVKKQKMKIQTAKLQEKLKSGQKPKTVSVTALGKRGG